MKRNLLLSMICALFTLCTGSLLAQTQVTIAAWNFEDGQGTATYTFWGTDELYGTTRPWALNEYQGKRDATFGAVYDVEVDGKADLAIATHTLVTTTTFGGYCINNSGNWNKDDALGKTVRYWLMNNISTTGLKDLVITLYMAGVGSQGPTEFKFGYKIGDGEWVDGSFKPIRSNAAAGSPIVATDLWTENVPAACNNQAKVAFRWVVGENMANGSPLVSGSSVRVDNIEVKATEDQTSIPAVKSNQAVYASGSQLIGGADATVKVYNTAGATVYSGSISKGETIELSKGVYIVKAISNNSAETSKVVIQ
jgi:hypothetical protein